MTSNDPIIIDSNDSYPVTRHVGRELIHQPDAVV